MKLKTLGTLELEGSDFKQARSLLLLTYLSLEGAKTRRFIADLFWPTASNPMNSVAVAVAKLRRLELLKSDDTRIWTQQSCDAADLIAALRNGNLNAAETYSGVFLETLTLNSLSSELEEWVFSRREHIAGEVRATLLKLAEQAAALGNFEEAALKAERASTLAGAAPIEPEDAVRLHTLLLAAEHPHAGVLEREAKDYGLSVLGDAQLAQKQLRRDLLGRTEELERLSTLSQGEWAWVRGGVGIGKTTLLKELASETGWQVLLARSGLPYITLERLLEDVEGGEDVLLRRLFGKRQNLILDDWEEADTESRALLMRLKSLKPDIRVVIASRAAPPFEVEQVLELKPLQQEDLSAHPGMFEATAGVPTLVGAWLRGEPLEAALQKRLSVLGKSSQAVYGALTLLGEPDYPVVRSGLELSAQELATALDELTRAGLIELAGTVRSRGAALDYLAADSYAEAQLALALARQVPSEAALPMFKKARTFLTPDDLPKVIQSYSSVAKETLRRGLPEQVVDLLETAPENDEIRLLRGQALERIGHYKDALAMVEPLADDPNAAALKSSIYWRLSKQDEATEAAQKALEGDMAARAEGLNTLGLVNLYRDQFLEAEDYFSRSAILFQGLGESGRWLTVLSNRAQARANMGEDVEDVYREVLDAAQDNLMVKARAYNNMGAVFSKQKRLSEAKEAYLSSVEAAVKVGALEAQFHPWNNLGTIYHEQNSTDFAEEAYLKALQIARDMGDKKAMGLVLSNLAELKNDLSAWQEAIAVLEEIGEDAKADEIRRNAAFKEALLER